MNSEIKAKWLAELRSGQHKQGQRRLCKEKPDGQLEECCLGVLCNMMRIPYDVAPESDFGIRKFYYGGDESTAFLPFKFADEVGLERTGVLNVDCQHAFFETTLGKRIIKNSVAQQGKYNIDLSHLNDKDFTFTELADIIEALY